MTPEERAREEAWTRRAAERENALEWCVPTAGNMPYPGGRQFPVPDTSGMTPAEREVVLDRWRAEVQAYMREYRAAHPPQPVAPVAASPAPPEVPAS